MTQPEEIPNEIWDAVVDVATYQRVHRVSGLDSQVAWDVCGLIEEVVRHIYPLIREQS